MINTGQIFWCGVSLGLVVAGVINLLADGIGFLVKKLIIEKLDQ